MNDVDRFLQTFAPKKQPAGFGLSNYQVTVVSAGASRDARAQVSILVGTANLAVPYLDSYLAPMVGDVVAVLFAAGSPLILGRVIGLPTF